MKGREMELVSISRPFMHEKSHYKMPCLIRCHAYEFLCIMLCGVGDGAPIQGY